MKLDENLFREEEKAIFRLRSLYRSRGYTQYRMSRFEEYELYVRNKDFLISDQVITFTDRSGRLLAMKPDVTLSILKNSRLSGENAVKVFYNENVYRVGKGNASFSEIMQTGLECIGSVGPYEQWEVLSLACESLGQISPNYMLDLSHMGMLTALLEDCGISGGTAKEILHYLGEKNGHDIERLCRENGFSAENCRKILSLAELSGKNARVLETLTGLCQSAAYQTALKELSDLCAMLWEKGYPVQVDFSIVNDMNYYSGLVFRGYIEGIPTGVLSGGQYDKLLRKMQKDGSAIGFAVYLDQLERLPVREKKVDADAVLIYDGSQSPAAVSKAVEKLSGQGKTVLALPRDDQEIRRHATYILHGEEVKAVE